MKKHFPGAHLPPLFLALGFILAWAPFGRIALAIFAALCWLLWIRWLQLFERATQENYGILQKLTRLEDTKLLGATMECIRGNLFSTLLNVDATHNQKGFFRVTLKGQILFVNPCLAQILGYKSAEQMRTEVTNTPLQIWLRPEERKDYIHTILQANTVRNFETEFIRRDGKPIWVSLSSQAIRDEAGFILYIEGLLLDLHNLPTQSLRGIP